MAKVTGPLQSFGASGQIAKSIVFGSWKGIAWVRRHVIPANPQSSGQGDIRVMVGGTGRSCGKVTVAGTINTKLQALDPNPVPSGQSKQSFLVKYIMDHYLTSATAYATQLAAVTGHTAYTTFQSAADTLGISAFSLAYASVATYDKALGLYLLAKTCQALGFTGEPYTTALSSWTATQVNAFEADF